MLLYSLYDNRDISIDSISIITHPVMNIVFSGDGDIIASTNFMAINMAIRYDSIGNIIRLFFLPPFQRDHIHRKSGSWF